MYVLVIWTRENNFSTISFRSIVSPRKEFAEYKINEAVMAKYRGITYPAKIVKKSETRAELDQPVYEVPTETENTAGNTNQSLDEEPLTQDQEANTDQETQITILPADSQVLDNDKEVPLPVIKPRKKQEKPVQKKKQTTVKEPTKSKAGNTNQSLDEEPLTQNQEANTDQETQITILPADSQVLDNDKEVPLPVIKPRKKQEKPVQKKKQTTVKEPTKSKAGNTNQSLDEEPLTQDQEANTDQETQITIIPAANYLSKDRYHRDIIRHMEEKRDKDNKEDSDESDSILSPPKKRREEAACNSSARLEVLESEIKKLKRKVKVLENKEKENLPKREELSNTTEVQEYNGFSKIELKNLISTTSSIPIATDLLLKKLFTTDEIKSHSISGKKTSKCGAEGPRPPMDQERIRIMSTIISEQFKDFSRKILVEKIQNIQKVYRRH